MTLMASAPQSSPPEPAIRQDLLSLKAVARVMDCHVNTVRNLIAAGKLKAVRVGRLVKVRRSAIGDYYRLFDRA